MDGSPNQPMDDGFESGDEDNVDLLPPQNEEREEHMINVTEKMIRYIPPPQQIKEKSYSLHPDMITGWAPKNPLPKPIPLTFPQNLVAQLLSSYSMKKPSQASLVYLGPHFDNTYSAWKTYGVEFPYSHLGNQRVVLSNRKFQGMSPSYPRKQIRFESMFESGNLDTVFKVGSSQFDCFMRVDANTRGHLQWYYFKIFNLTPGRTYQINLCNFQKAKSLYSRGMKPYLFSHRAAEQKALGWQQAGSSVEYSRKRPKITQLLLEKEDEEEDEQRHYILSFKVSTEYEDDMMEIAYCPPYTFTKLNNFLAQLASTHHQRDIILSQTFCTSLGGQKIQMLTLTNEVHQAETFFKNGKPFQNKILVFVIGRLHPGEANGSHMMEGFIKYLSGYSSQAQELRNRFIFKIVPMMNPDGVVIGNYRAGLSGRDFNRQFITPQPALFVEVAQLKTYLQRCKWIYHKQFCFFMDFHGHSVKKNVFAYGPQFPLTHSKYYESRLLPKLISKRTSLFRYYSCSFKVSEGKASTARAVLLRSYGIPFVYTIEASNGGYYDHQQKEKVCFTTEKWEFVGCRICDALYDYWIIFKEIEEVKLRRKKQRHAMLKGKGMASKRIQSSHYKSRTATNFEKRGNLHLRSQTSIAHPIQTKSNMLGDILSELTDENQKETEKCSDDQLSQGRSDSEGSQDDIDLSSMRAIIGVKKQGICRIKKRKTKEEQLKKSTKYEMRITKHPSFLTECDYDESPRRHPLIQRRKKAPNLHKKLCSMNSSHSPPPQQRQDLNSTAKIINLNFMLNPVAATSVVDKRQKLKTQTNEQYDGRTCHQSEVIENSRKTYLSLQRDSMRRQMAKRSSVAGSSSNPYMTSNNFRHHEIIGKRIFTET